MKKSQLIEKLVIQLDDFDESTNNKQKTEVARETVNLFFNSIKKAVQDGDRVEIRGFGSFSIKEYGEYTGRNPKTGAKVKVKPKKLPVFRPGRELRDMVNK
ncbi:MAG: integration host factor subunit beta [Deltaproteobacteria bacterium]|nr:integration host factor subunit beta [Deltaproteobacteria bacterium]